MSTFSLKIVACNKVFYDGECEILIYPAYDGQMARIEIEPAEFDKLMKEENRFKIVQEFKKYGFTYVTLDLLGYRCGSMNETLKDEEKR